MADPENEEKADAQGSEEQESKGFDLKKYLVMGGVILGVLVFCGVGAKIVVSKIDDIVAQSAGEGEGEGEELIPEEKKPEIAIVAHTLIHIYPLVEVFMANLAPYEMTFGDGETIEVGGIVTCTIKLEFVVEEEAWAAITQELDKRKPSLLDTIGKIISNRNYREVIRPEVKTEISEEIKDMVNSQLTTDARVRSVLLPSWLANENG
ncbi:flagellar basal body-associated FliL family protein [Candidatus Hydrogenedentota bacterium]